MAAIRMNFVIWHFIRTEYEEAFNTIDVPMALKYLITNFSSPVIGSKLMTIKEDLDFIELLLTKLSTICRFKLLYRASENEYLASKFHELCGGYGPTITIIKSNFGHIFGGYTAKKWPSNDENAFLFVKDENAFLFLIRSRNSLQKCPILFELNGIVHIKNRGPIFGSTPALCISDKCNTHVIDAGDIRSSYCCKNMNDDGIFAYKGNQLCGGNNTIFNRCHFTVIDYEVFEVSV
eukprot:520265_1